MTGSTDQFNPSLEGLVIRPGADEGRQERVMDVDETQQVGPTNSGLRICM
jgi:uncharacterized protein YheU (UPF0270 family)